MKKDFYTREVIVETKCLKDCNNIRTISIDINNSSAVLDSSFRNNETLQFEEMFNSQIELINSSSLVKINRIRDKYKLEIDHLNFIGRNRKLSNNTKVFYKNKRRYLTRLLNHTKVKIKEINFLNNNIFFNNDVYGVDFKLWIFKFANLNINQRLIFYKNEMDNIYSLDVISAGKLYKEYLSRLLGLDYIIMNKNINIKMLNRYKNIRVILLRFIFVVKQYVVSKEDGEK